VVKLANNVNLRVFCKEDEDKKLIVSKLKALLPFDLEKEKITIDEKKADGFNDTAIWILSVTLAKERHVNAFLKLLSEKLGEEKKTLLEQATTRLDDELNFFIRLDKTMLLKDKFVLTDSGKCYHIKINIAAFPKKVEKGLIVLKDMFK
jgi:RNA binding exosome subunit